MIAPPTGGLPYSTTANTLTLRADFAACVGKIDVLTQIQDRKFPAWSGKDGSVAIQTTRTGNTWTIPQALTAYPKGNRVNCWRIRLRGTPPRDVSYYESIMQTFVQAGAAPGVFEPRTTR